MELLQTRLQQEASRTEVYERKSAELERINDELRLENRRLIAEVDDLKLKLTAAKSFHLDEDSNDDDDDDDNDDNEHYENVDDISVMTGTTVMPENVSRATKSNGEATNSSLGSNTNNSNKNGTESGKGLMRSSGQTKKRSSTTTNPANIETKVLTLKRKQKKLEAVLQHQSISYQEAFQKELDLRARMEDKYESLRVRYDRLIEENDHMRTVLTNHCINVPPHKPITGKRRPQNNDIKLLSHPPSFVPPGRSKTSANSSAASSPSHVSRKKTLSPSEHSKEKYPNRISGDMDSISQHSSDVSELNLERTSMLSDEGVNGTTITGELSRHSSSSSISSAGDESLEHIVVVPEVASTASVLSATHVIDSSLMVTTGEIESAKSFYDQVRQRLKSESDSD